MRDIMITVATFPFWEETMTKLTAYIGLLVVALFLTSLLIHSRYENIEASILQDAEDVGDVNSSTATTFHELSWNGQNPTRVMALAIRMNSKRKPYETYVGMTSAFYSQINHLRLRREYLSALFYFNHARIWADQAKTSLDTLSPSLVNPIDYEVIGAADFMATVILDRMHLGWMFRSEALLYLERAHDAFMVKDTQYQGLGPALVSAKLWRLTKNTKYKTEVIEAGLTQSMDEYTLKRIAEHMGYAGINPVGVMFEHLLCKTCTR